MTYEEAVAIANASNESENQPFVIDKNLRTIAVPDGFLLGVIDDMNVQVIPFECPRFYNDFDLSTFNIEILYEVPSTDPEYDPYIGEYVPSNVVVGQDTITFSWVVDGDAYMLAGDIRASVVMEVIDPSTSNAYQRFGTRPVTLTVAEGLHNRLK